MKNKRAKTRGANKRKHAEVEKGYKEMLKRRKALHQSLGPQFGLGHGEEVVSMPGIRELNPDGSQGKLISESEALVTAHVEGRMTTGEVHAACIERISETPERRKAQQKIEEIGRRVADAYHAFEQSELARNRSGWTLARRLVELWDALSLLNVSRVPTLGDVAAVLQNHRDVTITEQRVGQCINTATYYSAVVGYEGASRRVYDVDQSVSLRVYDDARVVNEKQADKLTPAELAGLVKAHRSRHGLAEAIKSAIAVKRPTPPPVAAPEPGGETPPAPVPEGNTVAVPAVKAAFIPSPEPAAVVTTVAEQQSDSPPEPPEHRISIAATITGDGMMTFAILYDDGTAAPEEPWVDPLLSYAWQQLGQMLPSDDSATGNILPFPGPSPETEVSPPH